MWQDGARDAMQFPFEIQSVNVWPPKDGACKL
jgi:hypothetical protein